MIGDILPRGESIAYASRAKHCRRSGVMHVWTAFPWVCVPRCWDIFPRTDAAHLSHNDCVCLRHVCACCSQCLHRFWHVVSPAAVNFHQKNLRTKSAHPDSGCSTRPLGPSQGAIAPTPVAERLSRCSGGDESQGGGSAVGHFLIFPAKAPCDEMFNDEMT